MNRANCPKIFLISSLLVLSVLSLSSLAGEVPSGKEYIIGAEDVLEIQVWGQDDLHRTVEVSQEGAFSFPLIGKIDAVGLSVFELENLLRERLADGYLVKPYVTVGLEKYGSKKVFILGDVKNPGPYLIKGKIDLLALISEAGGLTEDAGQKVTITRPGPPENMDGPGPLNKAGENRVIILDLDQFTAGDSNDRFFVAPGDSIYVSRAPRFFVTGEVKKPGEFKWENGLTVRKAIAMAGGPTIKGAPNRTQIQRAENGSEREFRPKICDPVMPDDIVKVPVSYF